MFINLSLGNSLGDISLAIIGVAFELAIIGSFTLSDLSRTSLFHIYPLLAEVLRAYKNEAVTKTRTGLGLDWSWTGAI